MGWTDIRKYFDLIGLFTQLGWLETKKRRSLEPVFSDDAKSPPISEAQADQLTQKLEAMGPCYIKLGQFLSSRSDLLPKVMLTSLGRLQDDVAPFGFDEVRRIIESELGVRLSKAFLEFEHQPLASASLSQVHRAILPGGREVAVKVQRPDIQKRIFKDLQALQKFATLIERTTKAGKKIANRLTTGLILAALIVGAAFMMNVRTDFILAGYPGLAVIFFIIAGLGGAILIFTILFQDETAAEMSADGWGTVPWMPSTFCS